MWQKPFTLHLLYVSICVIGCYVINNSKSPFTTLHRPSSQKNEQMGRLGLQDDMTITNYYLYFKLMVYEQTSK